MKVLIGIQARSASKRLPRKIYQSIGPKSVLEWVYHAGTEAERIARAQGIEAVTWILGPEHDEELQAYAAEKLMKCYQPKGISEDDLIARYKKAMQHLEANYMIRITADCWRAHSALIVELMQVLSKFDYASNTLQRSFPEGLDLQGCSLKAMEWFDHHQKEEREHPFKIFDENKRERDQFEKAGFKYINLLDPTATWVLRTSIDTEQDLELARKVHEQERRSGKSMERPSEEHPGPGLSRNQLEAS